MFSGIRFRALALGTIPLLFMLAAFGAIFYLQVETQTAEKWAQHSDDVLAQVQRFDKSVQGASAAASRYIFAGQSGARKVFEGQVRLARSQARTLRYMVRDNPVQIRNAAAIQQTLERGVMHLRQYLTFAARGDRAAISALIVQDATERKKPVLSAVQQAFQDEEIRLQQARRNTTAKLWRALDVVLIAFTVFGIGFTIILNADFGRHIVRRLERLTRNAEAFGPGSPPSAPVGGSDEIARLDEAYRRTGMQLNAALHEALQASALKSQFVATMSHEIRTPMNGVIGTTDLLLRTNLNAQQTEYARTVRDSGEALLTVINEILDFSKIEAGKMELEVREVELLGLVEGAAAVLIPQAHSKQISLMTFVDPLLPPRVIADAGRLRQVLLNLGGNAVKFTRSGSVLIAVTAKGGDASKTLVEFSVKDSGIGMSAEVQKKLFQPFQQADGSTSRRYGGTGLGLTISQRLVTLMGGDIHVESRPWEGSTFSFMLELPVAAAGAQAVPKALPQRTHVLIVDDDPISCDILSQYFSSWSMTYEIVHDPRNAVERLARAHEAGAPFTVGVIDLSMPHLNGLQLAAQIRSDRRFADLRLILVTAYDAAGNTESAAAAGFSDYLVKPVRQSRLFNSLVEAEVLHPDLAGGHLQQGLETKAGPLRILVAEDNAINRRLALQQLGIFGYSADTVENGKQAVERATTGNYDLILMDCQMPEMDGFEATRAIRNFEGRIGRHTRIIAMTANALSTDQQACIDAGMDGYLTKPVALERLERILKETYLPQAAAPRGASEKNGHRKHVLDFARLQELFGTQNNEIGLFLQSALPQLHDLVSRLSDCTAPPQCLAVAHELKGASANIGAQQLSEVAAVLERALQDDVDTAEAKQRVRDALSSVERAIDTYIESVQT